MKTFTNNITLTKNKRGCYILDTTKGCSGCNFDRPLGCYDNCYACNIAYRYTFNFKSPIKRELPNDGKQFRLFDFDDDIKATKIVHAINEIEMPFVRIGEMGDPSDDWIHTIKICKKISVSNKAIVLVTKHWTVIPECLLSEIKNIYINTSISALDTDSEIDHRLNQYKRLKRYCNSILRIVSCDFNCEIKEGLIMADKQEQLFKNENIIDTVFRPYKNNQLVVKGIIKTKKIHFMRSKILASVYKNNPYLGMCTTCPDMCGLKIA